MPADSSVRRPLSAPEFRQHRESVAAFRERGQRRAGIVVRRQCRGALDRPIDLGRVEAAAMHLNLDRGADVLGERPVVVAEGVDRGGLHRDGERGRAESGPLPRVSDRRRVGQRAVEVEQQDHREPFGWEEGQRTVMVPTMPASRCPGTVHTSV
jgi:hypothetical protein